MKNHMSYDGPICPYCDYQHTADEPFYYDEDLDEMECGLCCKKFEVRVSMTTYWMTGEDL